MTRNRSARLQTLPIGAFLLMASALLVAGLPPDLPFTPWFTSRGIAVEIAKQPPGPPWLRSRGEIPAPAARVWAAVADFAHYRELFSPAVKKADVLDRDGTSVRIHFVWGYPFPFSNRDAVVKYELAEEAGGGGRLTWHSDARGGDPKEGTRIEHVMGETLVEAAGANAARVTYAYFGDLGGKFPGWAEQKAWREEPVQYFRAIRKRLGLPDLPPDEAKAK